MRKLARVLVLVAVGAAPGCGSPAAPTPRLLIGPIQVDSLEIVRGASSPSGLGVRVRGVIGDGCSELRPPITQEREGTLLRITILRQRPAEAVCTQIAKLFDQVVPLAGDFPPGGYTVRVNGSELAFTVP